MNLVSVWRNDGHRRVWRQSGERYESTLFAEHQPSPTKRVMVSVGKMFDHRTPLVRINGSLTAECYVTQVVEPVVLPLLQGAPRQWQAQPRCPARLSLEPLALFPYILRALRKSSLEGIFAEQHKLIFNVSKSTSSFFTTNRRLYNYQPQIFMESKSLLYEKHPKYLGYILDPEILSNKHIDYVINKGRKRLDLLKYLAGRDWGADAGTLRLTYTSLIRPVLEYGSQIYFSASRTNLAKLDRVQSSAARIITGMRHSCPTDLVLFEADIMPLDLRRKLLLSKYFCKLYS
ncbi:putative RNA-directed DNA polymerase from transposon BS [Trichonephila clavipes]|nr:putative RNA-directed DNA polymerase from transposon BS [Trichonephila clavipes]